ncbi:hypothetical protein [Bradyrhizobium sp. HKCCYLR20261]|uniref:hypothetical protein n=1 Tax=Bradyrhizobium sp. HKCCYLR20261 TaxID=3420760 RepID=UPI003EB7AA18
MRKILPIGMLLLAAILLYVYYDTRLPPGVQAKGGDDWVSIASLVTSIISMIVGVVSATIQVLQHRKG